MEKTKKELGKLTGEEIVSESRKIFWNNRPLLWLQFALNLPSAIFSACLGFLLFHSIRSEFLDVLLNRHDTYFETLYMQMRDPFSNEMYTTTTTLNQSLYTLLRSAEISISRELLLPFLPLILLVIIGFVPTLAIGALSNSANIYAVELLLANKKISFLSVLEGATRLWPRMVVTLLYSHVLLYSGVFLYIGSICFVMSFLSQYLLSFVIRMTIALLIVRDIVSFYGMRFKVAYAVSIFEDLRGRSAFQRAEQLLQGKKQTALRTEGGYSGLVRLLLLLLVFYNKATHLNDSWNLVGVLLVVSIVVWIIFRQQMYSMSAGVSYVSFKAYYENNAKSSSEVDVEKIGERALLKSQSPLTLEGN